MKNAESRTSTLHKFLLMAFGLFLGIVILELSLRAGGFILTSLRERANRISLKEGGEYVILCLGESTTALGGRWAYPRQLEDVLLKRNTGIKFSVLNKGIAGTTTTGILSLLQDNLDTYQPDMVIAMMGINDELETVVYGDTAEIKAKLFFEGFRVYKLAKLLQEHIAYKINEIQTNREKKKAEAGLTSYLGEVVSLDKVEVEPPVEREPEEEAVHLKDGDWYLARDHFAEALPFYRKELENDPANLDLLIKTTRCCREIGKHREAREKVEEALRVAPQNIEVNLELGMICESEGKLKEAEESFREAIAAGPNDPRGYIKLGFLYRRMKRYPEVEALYQKAVELNPKNVWLLGDYYWEIRDFEKAESAYRKALKVIPETTWLFTRVSNFYQFQKRYDEAEEVLKQAIEIDPENPEPYLELRRFYSSLARWEEASNVHKKVIAKNPRNPEVYLKCGDLCLEEDDWNGAYLLYKKALENAPDKNDVLVRLASCLRMMEKFDEAGMVIQKVMADNPRNYWAYIEWGDLRRDREQWDEAELNYKRALEINPDTYQACFRLEELYEKQGRDEEAAKMAEMGSKVCTEKEVLYARYIKMGRDHHRTDRFELAERLFEKAIQLLPERDLAYIELGLLYEWQGKRREREEELFRKAVEINPKADVAHAHLGFICQRKGDWEKSEEFYKKAFESCPANNFAFSQLTTLYMAARRYREVVEMCNRVIEADPNNDRAWGTLALCYEAQGDKNLARKYFDKVNELRAQHLNEVTARNYQKLRSILAERGVQLVCTQYAMRPLGHLERMLPERERLIFVDNEEVFKSAVARDGYDSYFSDNFAGDFGHCTPQGNRLLAENIADTILKEVFGRAPGSGSGHN